MARRWPLFLAVCVILASASWVGACPTCSGSIPNSDAQDIAALPAGFNLSIYAMLGGLFAVVAGFGLFITRTIRATDRAHTLPPPPDARE